RGEKRIEDLAQRGVIHSHAIIVNVYSDVVAGGDLGGAESSQVLRIDFLRPGKNENRSLAVFGNGFGGVDHQIHDQLLELSNVGVYKRERLLKIQAKRDVFWNRTLDERTDFAHEGGHVGRLYEEASLPRVSEQLFG